MYSLSTAKEQANEDVPFHRCGGTVAPVGPRKPDEQIIGLIKEQEPACGTVSGNRGKVFPGLARSLLAKRHLRDPKKQECPDLMIASLTGQRHSAFWRFRLQGQASDMKVNFA